MIIAAYIPHGFSDQSRAKFLVELKKTFRDALGVTMGDTSCYIHECRPEDLCEEAAGNVLLMVYLPEGDTPDQYEQIGRGLDAICASVFGENIRAGIVFRKHHMGNVCVNGKLQA